MYICRREGLDNNRRRALINYFLIHTIYQTAIGLIYCPIMYVGVQIEHLRQGLRILVNFSATESAQATQLPTMNHGFNFIADNG